MEIIFSVVVPTYKRPALLKNCIDALSRQTLDASKYEVIVVSDGPDADTEALVRTISDKAVSIRYLALAEKKGPAAARNLGWQQGSGKLIAFTDDDCLPDTNWLKAALNEYNNEAKIVFSGKLVVPMSAHPTDHELNTGNLQTAEFITANCFCTREALEAAGGFDERFGLAWREDSDLQFRFITLGIPIVKISNAIVIHPVRAAPWGFSMKEQKKGLYNALLYKKYPVLYRKKIQPAPAWNYYVMILCVVACIVGWIAGTMTIAVVAIIIWPLLMLLFIKRRLSNTSHDTKHVMEMIVTSLAIPFLSVYWQLYGAVKYRVWLL